MPLPRLRARILSKLRACDSRCAHRASRTVLHSTARRRSHETLNLSTATTAYQVEQRLEGLHRQKNQLTVKTQELERLLLSIEAPLRSRCGYRSEAVMLHALARGTYEDRITMGRSSVKLKPRPFSS